jgi:hypothetical protein
MHKKGLGFGGNLTIFHIINLITMPRKAPEERLNDYTRETRLNKRGRMDLPFSLLTMLILVTGLIMLLSASYARSYYETYDPATGSAAPLTYFIRQLYFGYRHNRHACHVTHKNRHNP